MALMPRRQSWRETSDRRDKDFVSVKFGDSRYEPGHVNAIGRVPDWLKPAVAARGAGATLNAHGLAFEAN